MELCLQCGSEQLCCSTALLWWGSLQAMLEAGSWVPWRPHSCGCKAATNHEIQIAHGGEVANEPCQLLSQPGKDSDRALIRFSGGVTCHICSGDIATPLREPEPAGCCTCAAGSIFLQTPTEAARMLYTWR
jgi:hypothetical protein